MLNPEIPGITSKRAGAGKGPVDLPFVDGLFYSRVIEIIYIYTHCINILTLHIYIYDFGVPCVFKIPSTPTLRHLF